MPLYRSAGDPHLRIPQPQSIAENEINRRDAEFGRDNEYRALRLRSGQGLRIEDRDLQSSIFDLRRAGRPLCPQAPPR